MNELTPKVIFEEKIKERLENNPDLASQINAVYQFNITGDQGGNWYIDLTQSPGRVEQGTHASPGCTITVGDNDFVDIVTGKLNAQMAFMTQKLRISGNMALALKLTSILKG